MRAVAGGSRRRGGQLPQVYLPAARRCQRVRFNIFLCFFLRIRLRRFLMSDPMAGGTLAEIAPDLPIGGPSSRPTPRQSATDAAALRPEVPVEEG